MKRTIFTAFCVMLTTSIFASSASAAFTAKEAAELTSLKKLDVE